VDFLIGTDFDQQILSEVKIGPTKLAKANDFLFFSHFPSTFLTGNSFAESFKLQL